MPTAAATVTTRLIFEQPDTPPPETAPPDYRPAYNPDLIHDDELQKLAPPAWHRYFNGGSNIPVWVRADTHGDGSHFVEHPGIDAPYQAYGKNYTVEFANAYDAFHYADQQAG